MLKQKTECPKCGHGTKVILSGNVEIRIKYFMCQHCQVEFNDADALESILRDLLRSIEEKKELNNV